MMSIRSQTTRRSFPKGVAAAAVCCGLLARIAFCEAGVLEQDQA